MVSNHLSMLGLKWIHIVLFVNFSVLDISAITGETLRSTEQLKLQWQLSNTNVIFNEKTEETDLTHWGRVTHICLVKLIIIGLGNGLSPGRRQAIIWTNAGMLSIWPSGTNLNKMMITIHIFSFKKMHSKMSSAKWRPNMAHHMYQNTLTISVLLTSWKSVNVAMFLTWEKTWTKHKCWCQWRSLNKEKINYYH